MIKQAIGIIVLLLAADVAAVRFEWGAHRSKEYQAYLRPVLTRLEALPANKFQPNLELLEQLIASLEVRVK